MKGRRNLPLCESNWWGNCCSGIVTGTGDYRKNLCTKLTSILQPGRTHLGSYGTHKNEHVNRKDKVSASRAPELALTKTETKKESFKYILAYLHWTAFFSPCRGTIDQNKAWLFYWGFFPLPCQIEKFIPLPWGVELIKTYCYSPLHGGPTYRHTIRFVNCKRSVTYTL